MMLIAETRPSSAAGVTVWRSVVVLITHRIGPAPKRKNAAAASTPEGAHKVSTSSIDARKPQIGPTITIAPKLRKHGPGPWRGQAPPRPQTGWFVPPPPGIPPPPAGGPAHPPPPARARPR